MRMITLLILSLIVAGCSSTSNNPKEPVKLTDGVLYFPAAEGDTWYYSLNAGGKMIRTISGDTTISGVICKRILKDSLTDEAWTVDSVGFHQHLLGGIYRFEPPLLIPFNLVEGKPYNYSSKVYFIENGTPYESTEEGNLLFQGYVTWQVPAGTFKNAIKLDYNSGEYYEYYAKGVGLLDNGDMVLDSARIDGLLIKP